MTSTEISEQDITALIARWSEAAQLIMNGDLRAYARKYIVGKPHITGVLIAPEARQALKLAAQDLVMAGTR